MRQIEVAGRGTLTQSQDKRSAALQHVVGRGRLIRVLGSLLLLPTVTIDLSDTPAGRAIRAGSEARGRRALARSVYDVPADGRAFTGRSAHGRRNAVNRARAAGLTTQTLSDGPHPQLLDAFGWEPVRCACGSAELSRTYAAFAPDGKPLAASHVHVDGRVAQLVLAVHVRQDEWTGAARYAVFAHAVEELAAERVDLLLLYANFFVAAPGIREFQKILGFRPVNLKLQIER